MRGKSSRKKTKVNNTVVKKQIMQAETDDKSKEVEEPALSKEIDPKSNGVEENAVIPENSGNQANDTNKILDKVTRYAGAVGSIWSIILVLLTFSFGLIEYVWNWGKYDFWNIPTDYIELKMNELLLYAIAICAVLIVTVAFGYLICYYILFFKVKNKFLNFIKSIGVLVVVYAICFVMFVAILCFTPPYFRIITFSAINWLHILKATFELFIIIFLFSFSIGFACFFAGLKATDIKVFKHKAFRQKQIKIEEKEVEEYQRRIVDRVYRSWGILMIIIPVFILALTLYNDAFHKCADSTEVEIVTVDDKEYVIAGIYDGKWILKECILDEEMIRIKKSSYTFQEISNYPILHYNLNENMSIKDCMVDEL